MGHPLSHFAVGLRIGRLPRTQAIHLAIEHAECGRDRHGVMDFPVGGASVKRTRNIVRGDVLAALLNLAGDGQQRLHLFRDIAYAQNTRMRRGTRFPRMEIDAE
jgi:hypothetical protein